MNANVVSIQKGVFNSLFIFYYEVAFRITAR
jgi:hypothetical protein